MSEDFGEVQELSVKSGQFIEADARGQTAIHMQYALDHPRSITGAMKNMETLATINQDMAEECFYALPRGGKTIEGPSIRFAEIVASCYGNIRVLARIIAIDDKTLTVQAIATDLQTNNGQSAEVVRRITDRNGRRYNEDMIAMTANAAMAIAKRNATFSVVPKAYWNTAYEAARKVAIGSAATLSDRRSRAFEAFQKMGVTPQKIYEKFGVHGEDDITLEHLAELTGLRNALKEGAISVDEAFPRADAPQAPGGKRALDKQSGTGKVQEESYGTDGFSQVPESAGDSSAPKGRKTKEQTNAERLAKVKEFVSGPIELLRDTPHSEFIDMCKGLSGDELVQLLMEYDRRRKEIA